MVSGAVFSTTGTTGALSAGVAFSTGAAPQPTSRVKEARAERIRADSLRKFFMVYSPLAKLCFVFPYIYPIGSAGGEVKETENK